MMNRWLIVITNKKQRTRNCLSNQMHLKIQLQTWYPSYLRCNLLLSILFLSQYQWPLIVLRRLCTFQRRTIILLLCHSNKWKIVRVYLDEVDDTQYGLGRHWTLAIIFCEVSDESFHRVSSWELELVQPIFRSIFCSLRVATTIYFRFRLIKWLQLIKLRQTIPIDI